MKKSSLLCLFLALCFGATLMAQSPQATLEVPGNHHLFPAAEKGVILLDRDLLQMSTGDLAVGFSRYDSLLEKKWTNHYPFSKGMSLAFQRINREGIYLLFADRQRKKYELIVADANHGHYERSSYDFSEAMLVSELEAYYDQIWISGMVGSNPVLFKLDSENNTYQIVPVGLPGEIKYVGALHYHAFTSSLDYVILGEVDKKDMLVWRSVTEQGKVIVNEKLPVTGNTIQGLQAIRLDDESLFVAGRYAKGNRDKVEGFFTAVLGPRADISFQPFKQLAAVSSYRRWQEVGNKGYQAAKAVKFNRARQVYIDRMQLNAAGEVEMALEVYAETFRARGTLERQFIARDRTAQIDLNVYGRRDALGTGGETETMEDLMARGTATDRLQYRYMNQSLSKVLADGMQYNHSSFLRFSPGMQLLQQNSLSFGMKDDGYLTSQVNCQDGVLRYFKNGRLLSFNTLDETMNEKLVSSDEAVQLIPWYRKAVLGVSYDKGSRPSLKLYRFVED